MTVHLEVEDNRLLLIEGRYEGSWQFPIGHQEDVLSLISGGFDSGVSSYMLMRRGCACITASLTSAARRMKIGVRQVAHYLWNRFGSSHRVHLSPLISNRSSGKLSRIDDGRWALSSNV
ncbi:hypothetical protein ACNKHM_05025 [Shigella sonnei]